MGRIKILLVTVFCLFLAINAHAGPFWTSTGSSGYPTDCGESNYTGGTGNAACVSSASYGATGMFVSILVTPQITFTNPSNITSFTVSFLANYQDLKTGLYTSDNFIFGRSTDGGGTISNDLFWDEDHGTFRNTPGESVTVDLSTFLSSIGTTPFVLAWSYFDNSDIAWDLYAQIDDVLAEITREGETEPTIILSEHFDSGIPNGWQVISASAPIPEPSTFLLLGFGLAGVGLLRRRFKN